MSDDTAEDTAADEVVEEVEDAVEADEVETDDGGATAADVPTATAVLEYIVSSLVQDQDAVEVGVNDSKRTLQLEVRVGPDDMGRVIGRRGRVANAIRTLTRAAAARDGVEVDIEFLD